MQTATLAPKKESARATSQPKTSLEIIAGWLRVFDRLPYPQSQNRKPLTEEDFVIYAEALYDLSPETIDAACKKWMREGRFFPLPGDLRGGITKADSAGLALEAADAWDRYLAHVQRYFHPDLGWDRRAPGLDAITEHAARAAGGAHWVESCPESDLQWARKRFIESYTVAHETGQSQNLLTRGEAKKILGSLTAAPQEKQLPHAAPVKQLPRPAAVEKPSKPDTSVLQTFAEVSRALHKAAPLPTITEGEWQARKDKQIRMLAEAFPGWREEHKRKVSRYVQLRAGGSPNKRIARQLFPDCTDKERLRLLEQFASNFREEIDACAGSSLTPPEQAKAKNPDEFNQQGAR
jgi:hypothetical protein